MLIWRTMDSSILMRTKRNKMLTLRTSIITLKVLFFLRSVLCLQSQTCVAILNLDSFFKVWLRLNLKKHFLGLLRLFRWNLTKLTGKTFE